MRQDTNKGFTGFVPPTKNFFQMPNNWIDISAEIRDISELKIVQYVIRHTWGFHEYGISKTISVDEFMQGRRRQDGSRMDKGTRLSEQSVRNGIKKAVDDGYLICEIDASDAGRIKKSYTLKMLTAESEVQTLDPPQTLDLGTGTNFIPQGTNLYTSDSQSLDPRVSNFIPRTEKDTIERHLKKDTEDTSVSADAERTHTSSDYPIATHSRDTTHEETEQGDDHGNSHRSIGNTGRNSNGILGSDTHETSGNQSRIENTQQQEIDDAAYDAFFAPFPPEILAHPSKQAELSTLNVDKQANGVEKPVQDTQKTGKPARKPKAKEDASLTKRIDAVLDCLDALAAEYADEPNFKYPRSKAARDEVKTLLTSWERLTQEQVKAVYRFMMDSPRSNNGWKWSEHMSVKAFCNNFATEFAKWKAKVKEDHAQTENGQAAKKVSAAVAAGYTDYTGSEPMNYRPLRMPDDRNRKRA